MDDIDDKALDLLTPLEGVLPPKVAAYVDIINGQVVIATGCALVDGELVPLAEDPDW